VQLVPESWPTLHLEASIPAWDGLRVGGLVARRATFDLAALQRLGADETGLAVHCVWGWSRTDSSWTGVRLGRLLDEAGPLGSWVTVHSASGEYSSCLPRADAARGLLAWARDGVPLAPQAGGPLRFLPPDDYWAYKGVKWAARVGVRDRFVPGPWECRVADPLGRIPADVELPAGR
jgi:DMSO/TMAO reductase YedYZ molybdopterin-dependent catalytic subunit